MPFKFKSFRCALAAAPLVTLFLGSLAAQASTINLDSSAANTTNSSGQPTLNIAPHPSWAPALQGSLWVSDAITGNPASPGYVVLPNGTTVTFSQNFNLDAPATSGYLSVLADDTTSVVINGLSLASATLAPAGGYPVCSAQPIGCLTSTQGNFTFAEISPFLKVGANNIQFTVFQKNEVSFGLDYAGTISTAPEPGTLALIGSGLALVAFLKRRRTNDSRTSA